MNLVDCSVIALKPCVCITTTLIEQSVIQGLKQPLLLNNSFEQQEAVKKWKEAFSQKVKSLYYASLCSIPCKMEANEVYCYAFLRYSCWRYSLRVRVIDLVHN